MTEEIRKLGIRMLKVKSAGEDPLVVVSDKPEKVRLAATAWMHYLIAEYYRSYHRYRKAM